MICVRLPSALSARPFLDMLDMSWEDHSRRSRAAGSSIVLIIDLFISSWAAARSRAAACSSADCPFCPPPPPFPPDGPAEGVNPGGSWKPDMLCCNRISAARDAEPVETKKDQQERVTGGYVMYPAGDLVTGRLTDLHARRPAASTDYSHFESSSSASGSSLTRICQGIKARVRITSQLPSSVLNLSPCRPRRNRGPSPMAPTSTRTQPPR